MKQLHWILCFALFSCTLTAQQKEEVLFTLGPKEIYSSEFLRLYEKNNVPGFTENQLSLEEYLELFINYKLKVLEAEALGLDTLKSFQQELKGYREQLSLKYLRDTAALESIYREAYERMNYEIDASHILIRIPPSPSPQDTLDAYDKAIKIRERVLLGEPFENVARGASEDLNVKNNGGRLGYFTAFQLPIEFEKAAFALDTGEVSFPVRTDFGYHIIQVWDKRPARGQIQVSHLMRLIPPGSSEAEKEVQRQLIDSLYQRILEGDSFAELARTFSEDPGSKNQGGLLPWFGIGRMVKPFEQAAFALKNPGDISAPVQTSYGWHIIKLEDRKPLGSFEENKSFIESKIPQSYIQKALKPIITSRLKAKYGYELREESLAWFLNRIDSLVLTGEHGLGDYTNQKGLLFRFNQHEISQADFARFILQNPTRCSDPDPENYLRKMLEEMVSEELGKYQRSRLEAEYPEFRHLMKEFREGMLLFELTNTRIWKRAAEDSTGLEEYYHTHIEEYQTPEKWVLDGYHIRDERIQKKLAKNLRRHYQGKISADELKEMYTRRGTMQLEMWTDSLLYEPNTFLHQWPAKKGLHVFAADTMDGYVYVKEIILPKAEPLEEIRGLVISDYQNHLEKEWIRALRQKYPLKIQETVLEKLKARIQ